MCRLNVRALILCACALLTLFPQNSGSTPSPVPSAIWPLQTLEPPHIGFLDVGIATLAAIDRDTAITLAPGIPQPNAVVYQRDRRGNWHFDSLLSLPPGFEGANFDSILLQGDWALAGIFVPGTDEPASFRESVAAYRRVRGKWVFWQILSIGGSPLIFGERLSFDGKTALINGFSGAFVFELDSRQRFVFKATLTPPANEFDPAFGVAVAVRGDVAAVSSTSVNNGQGAVYIYRKSQNWAQTQVLTRGQPDSLNVIGAMFGSRLAISGRTLAIAAPYDDFRRHPDRLPQAGSIYLFRDDGSQLQETGKIPKPDAGDGTFGETGLALEGNTLVANVRAFLPLQTTPLIRDRGYVFKRFFGKWINVAQIRIGAVSPDIAQKRLVIGGDPGSDVGSIFVPGPRNATIYDLHLRKLPIFRRAEWPDDDDAADDQD